MNRIEELEKQVLIMGERAVVDFDDPLINLMYLNPPSNTYRLAKARNLGAANAKYSRLVFTDQDCIPHRDFIQRHYDNSADLTIGLRRRIPIDLVKSINNVSDIYYCNYTDDERIRIKTSELYKLAFGCNIGIKKDVFVAVNGFDERFIGWGFEDLDLAVRLYCLCCSIKIDYDLITYHLDHLSRSSLTPEQTNYNKELYMNSLNNIKYFI